MKIKTTLLIAVAVGVMAGWTATVRAQDGAAEAAAPKKTTLMDLIKGGGWAMWPLGTLSFAMIAMATVNYQKINSKNLIPPETLGLLKAAAKDQDVQKVYDLASSVPSLFTNALAAGLRKINPDDPVGSKPLVENAISEAVAREESQFGFWINFLSLISAVSPMVGLLGTVSGMIGAFQKIGAGGMGKPEVLAGDIGQALITTATGLIIAIPAMFFFFMFRNSLNRIIQKAEGEFSIILDNLTGSGVGFEEEE
ncbi:MAG TPA: MotA/TolQ/ExbB proton channel family protein [Kiritimatiellia bacterium]|nr:MotA/TolQ/ExbB proton channel family protein [Kiritimatiellia bacterium]HMO99457.1 MotA/TolQ/ExbB proton channel family protein [Kiritimatiellia bacterium]HMP97255.1 MotA/TolQ/ExbB proton channel family protein [Kiritimatiellia bacterium]